jgi:hypothetical protein
MQVVEINASMLCMSQILKIITQKDKMAFLFCKIY